MNDAYYEELADYVMMHKVPAFLSNRNFNAKNNQPDLESITHKTRLELIERMKTDTKYKKRCEEKRRNMEELKWNFGKK